MRTTRQSGVTLIELLVTIGIAAVLLTLALPNFSAAMRSSRVATAANTLLSTINFARSEALRSKDVAHLCPSSDGISCGGDWNSGVMVWTDENRSGSMDAGEIRRVVAASTGIRLSASGTGNELSFDNFGRLVGGGTPAFTVRPDECTAGAQLQRSITINQIGRATVARENCQ